MGPNVKLGCVNMLLLLFKVWLSHRALVGALPGQIILKDICQVFTKDDGQWMMEIGQLTIDNELRTVEWRKDQLMDNSFRSQKYF